MVEKLVTQNIHVGLIFANQKRRIEFNKLFKQRKILGGRKDDYFNIYGTLEQALSDCELKIDLPVVLSPRNEISEFKNVNLQNLNLFCKMLKNIRGKASRQALLRSVQLGIGKLVWINKGELVYHEFERSDGVFFLCYGRVSAIILDTINERVSLFNRQENDIKDLKRLWTITEVGSLIGNVLERKGISYTTETMICDTNCLLYHINEENLYKFEELDEKEYTVISQWELELRYRKMKYLIERVKMSRQFILS